MCGIAGLCNLDRSPIDPYLLDLFTDTLTHRGPDDRGTYLDPQTPLGLGHRRLAILDLSPAGHQPMSYANGRYWIVFNGEIFNFLELRQELQTLGYHFQSNSDTEVILAAYDRWGTDCQIRFNGMWAFAIWDRRTQTLFLSRDRFGVKPLHYYYDPQHFAFASETKSFLCLPWFTPQFDPGHVTQAILGGFSTAATEATLLQGIQQLKGGYHLLLTPNSPPKIQRWWHTLHHLPPLPESYPERVAQFRELFIDACRLRMRSDVPLGTALSGGLDSSAVHCTLATLQNQHQARQAQDWQKAYIATFPNTDLDERSYAEQVITHTRAIPHYQPIHPNDILDNLEATLFQHEEISHAPGVNAVWLLYRQMRRHNTVISLDGHGGDELLGGYIHYLNLALQDALIPWINEDVYHQIQGILQRTTASASQVTSYQDPPEKATWLTQIPITAPIPGLHEDLTTLRQNSCLSNTLNRNLYIDFHHGGLSAILRNFDRCSMAHGVEIRAPLLDWRIVCFSFALPAQDKIGGSYSRRIFRDAMINILPEPIRTRNSKIGFGSPLAHWLEHSKYLQSYIQDLLSSTAFLQSALWKGDIICDYYQNALASQNFHGAATVWPFVNTHILFQQFSQKNRL